jgi:hypothetical protein
VEAKAHRTEACPAAKPKNANSTYTAAPPPLLPTNLASLLLPYDSQDTSEVTKLFAERLQAWKHACGYLQDYITATEKTHHAHGKEYERILKTVKDPLKEGHHFDQSLGGIAGMFENIRSNTQVGFDLSEAVTPLLIHS